MQLEAGKKYTDRRGRVYGPLVSNDGCFGETAGDYFWHGDGRKNSARELQADLVAEYVEPVNVLTDCDKCGEFRGHGHDEVCKAAPVESPDDWVTQDRVPARAGVDQELWSNWLDGRWRVVRPGVLCASRQMKHGQCDNIGDKLSLRCRRKDLPPVPPKTRTVILKEWLCWDDDAPEVVAVEWCSTPPNEELGKFLTYDNAVETGNTRTVEIPVT